MSGHAEQPPNTFIIRFWWEWQGEGPNQTMGWRGRIEHLQSGEGMAFHEQRQMLAFIERFMSPLPSSTCEEEHHEA